MLPLRDNIPSRSRPFVNYALIVTCLVLFGFQTFGDGEGLVERYGMIPYRVFHPQSTVPIEEMVTTQGAFGPVQVKQIHELPPLTFSPFFTLLTCTFLHGGWMHLLGNLWFLRIFGDNVEDRMGHLGYLLFYLTCGALASGVHLASDPQSLIPTIGASGAIAGVMGSYLVLYPRARVLTLIPVLIFVEVLVLPAPLFLGLWFAIQFFHGAFSFGGMQASGVAWWAHIGGFVAGAFIALNLREAGLLRQQVDEILENTDRICRLQFDAIRTSTKRQRVARRAKDQANAPSTTR